MQKPFTDAELREAVARCVRQLEHNLPEFTDRFQDSNSVGGFYPATENVEWTTGFCTGEYWLAYELTGNESFRAAALRQVDSFLRRIEQKIDVNHHDMGFLYSPSCVAAYQLTGSETGKRPRCSRRKTSWRASSPRASSCRRGASWARRTITG